jgi:hypothetical protein
MAQIPPSVIGTAAPILADWYTHTQLNALFDSHGFPGDAPDGNKVEKCRLWLRQRNKELPDPLTNFKPDCGNDGCRNRTAVPPSLGHFRS